MSIDLTIPLVPPSGNMYKRYRVITPFNKKPVVSWYLTPQANAWYKAVAAINGGQQLRAAAYSITYRVFTKSKVCSDVDNYAKTVLDSLAEIHGCGAIDDDKKVIELHAYREVDKWNPRTEVLIERVY